MSATGASPPPTQDEELLGFETFSEPIRRAVAEMGWSAPMPVQRRVTPVMRRGRDLIAQAMTGSGKTGAFGLPSLEIIDPRLRAAQVLVLAPTRELALQIENEIRLMAKYLDIGTIAVYGGTAYGPQLDAFSRGAQIVVGTPGRLLDHLGSGNLKLDKLRVLIFDEADELLSLGFWPDMREIHKHLPRQRQSCLFSATIPERVRSLSRVFLHDPIFVSLSDGQVAPQEIEHFFVLTTAQEKDSNLVRILEYEDPESAIIFCNTKSDVRYVTAFLQRRGYDADQISGDLTQSARELAMGRIKAGKLRFLVRRTWPRAASTSAISRT